MKVEIEAEASEGTKEQVQGPEGSPADEQEGRMTVDDGTRTFLKSVCGITTTTRRIGSAGTANTRKGVYPVSVPGTVGNIEIDNRADTTVFGANMTPIAFTGQSCDVQAFKDLSLIHI